MSQEIWEALENSALSRREKRAFVDPAHLPNRSDVAVHKTTLLRFLEELDGASSVEDVREALGDYRSDWRDRS